MMRHAWCAEVMSGPRGAWSSKDWMNPLNHARDLRPDWPILGETVGAGRWCHEGDQQGAKKLQSCTILELPR